jgi:hypothetical protein
MCGLPATAALIASRVWAYRFISSAGLRPFMVQTLAASPDRNLSAPVRQPLERFLLFRALLRCFLPGGPPALPFGVLESPGFFTFAIGRG